MAQGGKGKGSRVNSVHALLMSLHFDDDMSRLSLPHLIQNDTSGLGRR